MRFDGLLDPDLAEIIEFYAMQTEASAARETILGDEPGWESALEIVLVDFTGAGVRVERA